MDTMKSETPWRFHAENRERLEKYYGDKKQVLADLSEKVTVYDQNKANEEMKKKVASHQRKMDWIKEFMKDYEATEENTAYAIRANCENENIDRVLQSIKLGKFIGDYDNNATFYKENQQFYIEKIIPAMARLLKEADNLTIDGGTNYLEQFANLPEVNSILLQIKRVNNLEKCIQKQKRIEVMVICQDIIELQQKLTNNMHKNIYKVII